MRGCIGSDWQLGGEQSREKRSCSLMLLVFGEQNWELEFCSPVPWILGEQPWKY
jgi:hypothetical protein